jgi:hypothetical protein
MNITTTTARDRSGHRRRRFGRASPLATIVMTLGLTITACGGGDDGGSAGSAAASTAQPGATAPGGSAPASSVPAGEPDPLAFSQCMRDHGITNFPDPERHGRHLDIDADALGVDPSSPQYQAAEDACEYLLPQNDDPDAPQPDTEAMLAYAQCMRDNGIANFPDPTSNGFELDGDAVGIDTPQFHAADEACQHLLGEGGSTDVAGGEG